MKEFNKNQEIA